MTDNEKTPAEIYYHHKRLIEEACLRRIKLGEETYADNDITKDLAHLEDRDHFQEIREELYVCLCT